MLSPEQRAELNDESPEVFSGNSLMEADIVTVSNFQAVSGEVKD